MQTAHCCPVISERPAAVPGFGWVHPIRNAPIAPATRAKRPRFPAVILAAPASVAGAGQGKLDAAVLGPPLWRVIGGDRVSFAAALRRDQARIDALGDEEIGNGLRPFQRQLLVVLD